MVLAPLGVCLGRESIALSSGVLTEGSLGSI